MLAASEQRLDFIVVAQERDGQIGWTILEDKAPGKPGTTLEQLAAQFADAEAAVRVRSAKAFCQLAQSQEALCFFALREFA